MLDQNHETVWFGLFRAALAGASVGSGDAREIARYAACIADAAIIEVAKHNAELDAACEAKP